MSKPKLTRETAWNIIVEAVGGRDIGVLLTPDPEAVIELRLLRTVVLQHELDKLTNAELALLVQDHVWSGMPEPLATLICVAITRLGLVGPPEPEPEA